MLSRRLISAISGSAPYYTFVDAISGSDDGFITGTATVSAGDEVLLATAGKTPDAPLAQGTASLSFPNLTTTPQIDGSGGTQILVYLYEYTVLTGGTLYFEEINGREQCGCALILRPVDASGVSFYESYGWTNASSSASLSGIDANDAVILFETYEGSLTPPALRSGFTNAATEAWTAGRGGGATDFASRLSYTLAPSSSYTISDPGGSTYWGAGLVRFDIS